ncbi:MAG: aspartate-semialdehyde dehydrogenase [Candidatus Mycalebacterium zealandia]|nr:MAG: aspartate-semialdehyde dehydrogenase [Candidatus Mycalebacterium zealandia]
MKKDLNIAVVGATGAVGREVLEIFPERNFPVGNLKLLASERSRGKEVEFCGRPLKVEAVEPGCFSGVDIAIFSAGASNSRTYAPQAVDEGAVVVDNSSAFRMDDEVPLVVPEINGSELDAIPKKRIIANPNCTTAIASMALKPIHDAGVVKTVIATSFQSVSGAGAGGIAELENQIKEWPRVAKSEVFPARISLNIIPQIDVFLDNQYTNEEMKLHNETRKILQADIKVSATAVRVPVMRAHSVSMSIETEKPLSPGEVKNAINDFPGVQVTVGDQSYPMPIDCSGKDDCFVGRIRRDIVGENRICLWVVGDQLRKGAALNSVQIAERIANVL